MVVNENIAPQQGKKGPDWKIIAGLAVVVLLLAYILFRFFGFVSDHTVSAYEKTVTSYYNALGNKGTNTTTPYVTGDFIDETGDLVVTSGKYEIFAYRFEVTDDSPAPDRTNGSNGNSGTVRTGRLTYAVSTWENDARVSYLLEAVLIMDGDQPRIRSIKKLHKGRLISK